jgi:hypothetical protein
MKKYILGALVVTFALNACKKEEVKPIDTPETPVTESMSVIGTATTSLNETVTLYAPNVDLKVGYNKLYVTVKDANGVSINNANVTYAPLMDMGTMVHSCPIEQPSFSTSMNKYEGAAVFIMASSAMANWTLNVEVNGNLVTFPISVSAAPTKIMGNYTGTDGAVYFISVIEPAKWNVGLNDIEITLHKKVTMMDFPADNDFEILMTPEMISMGHGSPNNVSPTLIGNGHYKGIVNYTMTGDWRLHFELKKGGVTIHSDAYLDILF